MMWDWQGYPWGFWWLMWMAMVAFWAAIVWLVLMFARVGRDRHPDAAEILTNRFARGEIDAAEYRSRLDVLRHGSGNRAA